MPQFQYEELHAGPKQQLLGHRLQFFTTAIWAAESRYKDSKDSGRKNDDVHFTNELRVVVGVFCSCK